MQFNGLNEFINLAEQLGGKAMREWWHNGTKRRSKLAKITDIFYLIRFPLIPPKEFIKKIRKWIKLVEEYFSFLVPTYILNNEEIAAMLLLYTSNVNVSVAVPFSAKPRAIPPRGRNKLIDYDTKKFIN